MELCKYGADGAERDDALALWVAAARGGEGAGRVWPGSLQDLTAAVCCRYVEVFEANPLDVEKAKDREDGGGRGGRDRDRGRRSGGGFTVTLRGLPYRASEREIADWLSEAADPEDVIIVMDRSVARIGNI